MVKYTKAMRKEHFSMEPKVTRKQATTIAKRVVNQYIDKHTISANYNNVPLGPFAGGLTALIAPMLMPAEITTTALPGQIDSSRASSKLKILKIQFGIYFLAGAAVPRATARLILVRHPHNAGQVVDPLQVLQWSASPLGLTQISSYQPDLPYQILFDRCFSYGIQDDVAGKNSRYKTFTLNYKKHPKLVEYFETSTTGFAADVINGNMAWLLVCSDGTGTFSMDSKVTFTEV